MRILHQDKLRPATLLFVVMAMATTAAPLIAQDDWIHGEFVRTLEVDGKITLSVKNPNGKITVRVGTDDKVHIYGTIGADTKRDCDWKSSERKVGKFEKNHAFEMEGNRIRLGAWDDRAMGHCTLINYELQVPVGTALEIDQTHGDVKIKDVGGSLDLDLNAGSVRVTGAGAKVKARLGIGTLIVEGTPDEDWFLDVGTGSVTVRMPKDTGFNLVAETEGGTIDCDFSMKDRKKGGKASLRGSANGGGPSIWIKTKLGGIQIWETAVAATAAPLIAPDGRLHGEFAQTLEVDGKITLSVKNPNGKTTVRVATDDKVHIYGTISGRHKMGL